MSAVTTRQRSEMPLAHAGLALALLIGGLIAGGHLFPALLTWPFYLLAPLTIYLCVVLMLPPLRRSMTWMQVGRLDRAALTWLTTVAIVSSIALFLWHEFLQPDVSPIIAEIPPASLPLLLAMGLAFSCLNALLEEVLFRGLLFDALRVSYSNSAALLIQAGAFGVFHLYGFPNGAIGVVLATIYGLMQGVLRIYTGGLAACSIAHVLTDATIFALLLRHII